MPCFMSKGALGRTDRRMAGWMDGWTDAAANKCGHHVMSLRVRGRSTMNGFGVRIFYGFTPERGWFVNGWSEIFDQTAVLLCNYELNAPDQGMVQFGRRYCGFVWVRMSGFPRWERWMTDMSNTNVLLVWEVFKSF